MKNQSYLTDANTWNIVNDTLYDMKNQVNSTYVSPKIDYKRFAFDNLFFFIISLLITQILAGIIIETFSNMRDK
jgi:hypothetical protein